ncbi:MAG TPA: D-aminoacyl-tRNA deacylase [Clostridia bacterium]|nr:D-aminoacyl-tRNA deacylase [Clostridia bacterium]
MRCVVQRISKGKVFVNDQIVGEIGKGVLVLCGFLATDTQETIEWVANRIANLRIFPDENYKLNKSLLNVGGEALVVSNFTLYGDCTNGYRPSFSLSAPRAISEPLYDSFVAKLKEKVPVQTGKFGEHMEMELYSDGPITVVVEK